MILALCLLAATAAAAVAPDNLATAQAALEGGLPAVAIKKLAGISHPTKESALILARAYLEDQQPAQAVRVLLAQPDGGDRNYWLAQSYAALGDSESALKMYRSCREGCAMADLARIGEARMLRNLGESRDAIVLLEETKAWPDSPLRHLADFERAEALLDLNLPADARQTLEAVSPSSPDERSTRSYLLAKAFALGGDDAAALSAFDDATPLDAAMAVGIATGQARALDRSGKTAISETLLEDFLAKNVNLPGLQQIFSVLDSIYAGQPSASSSELKRWADDPDPSLRKTLAGYYLARFEARLGRLDRSQKLLENVVSENSSAVEGAALDLAALRLSQGHPEEVLHLLPETGDSAQGRFLRGLAFAALNEPDRASALFVSAASDPALAETALYNAAVCDLLAGKNSTVGLDLLKERFPSSPKIRGLALRKGYELARQKDASAPSVFEKLAESDDRGLSSLATLALAEWEYQNGDPASARRDLLRISTNGSTEPQADALAVFLTDDGRSDDAAIAAARKYLESHPGADAEPEVMMKLGEILFRKGDFAGARVQFESLAKKHPGTTLEFPALFLAAQSASRLQTASALDDAMLLFEEVASSKSPLALRARFEQAVLQNVLGKPNEAIILLDKVISSPGPSDLLPAARMEKGKTLYSQGSTDPKFYTSAIGVWKQIADDPATTPAWRNQALSRIGTAYENLGDPDSALAAYYDVLKDEKLAPESYFWFYKAGFAAARLLEATNRWEQAIKVYEMIAAAGGPRSEEATSRINKIRLENFLWDAPGS